jgi:hypothetical protein
VKRSEYSDKVTMHNPMEFDVKINYKIKESQDNAQTKKIKPQRHKDHKEAKKHFF